MRSSGPYRTSSLDHRLSSSVPSTTMNPSPLMRTTSSSMSFSLPSTNNEATNSMMIPTQFMFMPPIYPSHQLLHPPSPTGIQLQYPNLPGRSVSVSGGKLIDSTLHSQVNSLRNQLIDSARQLETERLKSNMTAEKLELVCNRVRSIITQLTADSDNEKTSSELASILEQQLIPLLASAQFSPSNNRKRPSEISSLALPASVSPPKRSNNSAFRRVFSFSSNKVDDATTSKDNTGKRNSESTATSSERMEISDHSHTESADGTDEDDDEDVSPANKKSSASSRDRFCLPCPTLTHISKKPLKVLSASVQRQYTVSKKETRRMTPAEKLDLVKCTLRIMSNENDPNELYIVAKDICLLIHIRKGNVAKSIGQFSETEKFRMSVMCPRSNGTVSTHVLTVLSLQGVKRLLTSSRSPHAKLVWYWWNLQLSYLNHSQAVKPTQEEINAIPNTLPIIKQENNNQKQQEKLKVEFDPLSLLSNVSSTLPQVQINQINSNHSDSIDSPTAAALERLHILGSPINHQSETAQINA